MRVLDRRIADDFEAEDYFRVQRYILYVLNAIFAFFASAVFAVGMYVTYDTGVGLYMESLFMDFYLNGVAVLMGASCVVVLNSLMGCCAGFLISRKGIIGHIVLTCLTFVTLLGGSIYVLSNGLESSNLFVYVQDTMHGEIQQYEWDMASKTRVDIIQEYIGCCGGNGDIDYREINLPIPNTCRDHVTGNQYGNSCAEVFSWYIEGKTGWMCGISLCICFLQIFLIVVCLYLYISINQLRRKI